MFKMTMGPSSGGITVYATLATVRMTVWYVDDCVHTRQSSTQYQVLHKQLFPPMRGP